MRCCLAPNVVQEAKQADRAAKQEAARRRKLQRWGVGTCCCNLLCSELRVPLHVNRTALLCSLWAAAWCSCPRGPGGGPPGQALFCERHSLVRSIWPLYLISSVRPEHTDACKPSHVCACGMYIRGMLGDTEPCRSLTLLCCNFLSYFSSCCDVLSWLRMEAEHAEAKARICT